MLCAPRAWQRLQDGESEALCVAGSFCRVRSEAPGWPVPPRQNDSAKAISSL
jgi:hypothetical protein